MKILILGDIYGQAGIKALENNLNTLIQDYKPDLVIANAENASYGGKSLTKEDYDRLLKIGINFFTMGNHAFKDDKLKPYIGFINNLVVPENIINKPYGEGFITFIFRNKKILLFNLLGRAFINEHDIANPFHTADKILKENTFDIAILDFHAEATAEKIVLANYLRKRVNIMFGTHTHIQTSDERIMDKMAYISDVGMVGVFDSAIGANYREVEIKQREIGKEKFKEAEGNVRINGIVVELDDTTNNAISIKRINKDV